MSFPHYPAYKQSGVEWVGEIPRDWALKPISALATCNDEVLGEDTPDHYVIQYVEISDVSPGQGIVGSTELAFGEAPSRARRRVKDGDVIVSTVRTYLRAIASIKHPSSNTVVSTGFAVMRPRDIDAGFLSYAFRAEFLIAEIIARSTGVSYPAINATEIRRLKVPVPPRSDQSVIAKFLDAETAKIDTLVAEQERLIGLLKEKRQAVISHAVTKGLDPNMPMKESGVEWMGEVPSHWRVCRMGYYATVENGTTPNKEQSRYWNQGTVPWVTSGEVNQYVISEVSDFITETALKECSLRLVPQNAILVGLIGQGRTRGMAARLAISATINQNVAAVITKDGLTPKYLHYSLQAAYEHLRECGRGGNQAALNCEILSSFKIGLPPESEQLKIATKLDEMQEAFGALIKEAKCAIDLLKERRSAVISAAVTGKIDVRNLAPVQEAA